MDAVDIPAMPIDGKDALARRFAGFTMPTTSDMTAYLVDPSNLEKKLLSLPKGGRRTEACCFFRNLLNTQVFERRPHAEPMITSEFKNILEERVVLEARQALRLSLASKAIQLSNLSLPDIEHSVPRNYQKVLLLQYAQYITGQSIEVDKVIEPAILFSRWILRSISLDVLEASSETVSVHVRRLEASIETTAMSSFTSSEVSAAEWVRQLSADLAEFYLHEGNFLAARNAGWRFFAAEAVDTETLTLRRPYFSDWNLPRMKDLLEACELAIAMREREQTKKVEVPLDCELRRFSAQQKFDQKAVDLLLFRDFQNYACTTEDARDLLSKRLREGVVETAQMRGNVEMAAEVSFCNALAASLVPPFTDSSACLEDMLEYVCPAVTAILGVQLPASERSALWFLSLIRQFEMRLAEFKASPLAERQLHLMEMMGNAELLAKSFMQTLCRLSMTPALWRLVKTKVTWDNSVDAAQECTATMATYFAECATSEMLDAANRNETVHGRLRRMDAADVEALVSRSMMPPQVARVYLAAEQYRKNNFRRSMAVNTLNKREVLKEDPDFKAHIQEIESRVEWSFFGFRIQEAMTMDWWRPDASHPLSAELLQMKKESFAELANRLAHHKYECPDVKILELFVAFCFKHEEYMYLVHTLPTLLNYTPAFDARADEISITEWSSKDGQLYLTIAVVLGLILRENNIAASEAGFFESRAWVSLPFDRVVNFLNLPDKMMVLAQKETRDRVLKTFVTVGEPIFLYLLASLLVGILCRIDSGNLENHKLRTFFGGPAALLLVPNLAKDFTGLEDEMIPPHFGQPQLEEKLAPILQTARENKAELVTALRLICEQLAATAAHSPLSAVCLMHAYLVEGRYLRALLCWTEATGELRRYHSERGDPGEQTSLGAPELAGRDFNSPIWEERVIASAVYCCQKLNEPLYAAVVSQFRRLVPYHEMTSLVQTAVEKYGTSGQAPLSGHDDDASPYNWLIWFWDVTMLEFIAATFKKIRPDAVGRVTTRIFRVPHSNNPSYTTLTLNSQWQFLEHMTRRLARMSVLIEEEEEEQGRREKPTREPGGAVVRMDQSDSKKGR